MSFDIFCRMLDPLNDGQVELIAKASGDRGETILHPEKTPDSDGIDPLITRALEVLKSKNAGAERMRDH